MTCLVYAREQQRANNYFMIIFYDAFRLENFSFYFAFFGAPEDKILMTLFFEPATG